MTTLKQGVLSVRVSYLNATFVAGTVIALALANGAAAQQGVGAAAAPRPAVTAAPSAPTGTNVAVIDVALIFKKHNRFNAAMQDIKKDIEDFDTFVRGEQTKMKGLAEQLQTFKQGSLEYKQKEEEIARLTSEMQVKIGLKRKEFLEQEARVYYHVYREIEQSVQNFAIRNRIGLVMRYNGDDMKEDDRASVLQGVNRAVVFQQNLDITQFILDDLNRGTVAPTTPSSTPRATAPQIPTARGPGGATAPR
jgi:Skp family chaperone for outer membrane proteins